MKIQLSKNHYIILILSVALIGLLYAGAYFLYLQPVKQRINEETSSIQSLDEKLTSLSTEEGKPVVNSYSLQQRLPVKPLTEQFVLDLEKAEIISNSKIILAEFAEDGQALQSEEQSSVEDTDQKEGAPTAAPEGMKQLTVRLEVISNNYYDMKTFIEEIEKQLRITKVEQLSFEGPEEIVSLDQKIEPITYELRLITYYIPSLTDLEKESPAIDSPVPSMKNNPLTPYIREKTDEES
ncbi:hypothetical protein [Metabacillus fastidiosus]|uniref:Pilus assembly protein PilO n=1 Tax=Metabacillus fastidiosus TaxID=1458 RepID=A0ABU6NVC3_9BACI|nr:hypothetical protein [Metabacillus fastidiosus]MED4453332.1 hypothetical protein [Metabacillus fastidiosus]